MAMFRSKKLDLGCFVNIKVIRDHTKRKVFADHEPERYNSNPLSNAENARILALANHVQSTGKPSDTSSAT
jgi:hypothetical protein